MLKKLIYFSKVVLQIMDDNNRVVRIRIGNPEGQALSNSLYAKNKPTARPLMYDVLGNFLEDAMQSSTAVRIERVVVDNL